MYQNRLIKPWIKSALHVLWLFYTVFCFKRFIKSVLCIYDQTIHGKTIYEWHTDDIRVHTSDIWMTYEYIRVTYGLHTSTNEWHTDNIRVHTRDIRIIYEYIRVTYEWHGIRITFERHTDDMRFQRKIKLSFSKHFEKSLSKYLICKRIPCM